MNTKHRGAPPHTPALSPAGNNGGSAPVVVERSQFPCRPAATRENHTAAGAAR